MIRTFSLRILRFQSGTFTSTQEEEFQLRNGAIKHLDLEGRVYNSVAKMLI